MHTHTHIYIYARCLPCSSCPDLFWHQTSVATQEVTLQLPMSPLQEQREGISYSASLFRNLGWCPLSKAGNHKETA